MPYGVLDGSISVTRNASLITQFQVPFKGKF